VQLKSRHSLQTGFLFQKLSETAKEGNCYWAEHFCISHLTLEAMVGSVTSTAESMFLNFRVSAVIDFCATNKQVLVLLAVTLLYPRLIGCSPFVLQPYLEAD
jgi:hypothetical protein